MSDFQTELTKGLETLGVTADSAQVEKLVRFAGLLERWNKVYNLTAIRCRDDILTHHLLDSAALVPHTADFLPQGGTVLDVGSGGGLPSIPLAVLRPDVKVTAVDAVSKKTAFLTQAGIELGLRNFTARHSRVEKLSGGYDVMTSRAFASLSDFVSLTRHLMKPGGVWLAMKGVIPEDEIKALPDDTEVAEIRPLQVPGLPEQRHLIVIRLKG